jgi:hypothetical protein
LRCAERDAFLSIKCGIEATIFINEKALSVSQELVLEEVTGHDGRGFYRDGL